jgi:hypothetical protein
LLGTQTWESNPALSAWEAEEQELSGLGSVGSLDPVEREVGDGVGCVVGGEALCVIDEGELNAVGEIVRGLRRGGV